jgi:hypothetical protein
MSYLGSRLDDEKNEMLIEWDNQKSTLVDSWEAERALLVCIIGNALRLIIVRKIK